jgi:hypothetical protein
MDRVRRAEQLIRCLLIAVLLALGALAVPAPARAGEKDTDAVVAIAEGMNEFIEGKYAPALKKLEDALKACAKVCESGTRAQLHFHIGVIHGLGDKNKEKARASFESALREDPKLVPDRQFMSKDLDKLFAEAKVNVKKSGGAPPPAKAGPSKEQLDAVATAEGQLASKDWSGCMGTIIAAMGDTDFAAGKLMLARCQDQGDLLLEAMADAKAAAKLAEEEGNNDVGRRAAELIEKLENDTPTITLVIPKAVDKPQVTIDGVAVPADAITKPIPHNPGKATIEVKGKRGPYPYAFKSTENFDRGEKITVQAEQTDTNTSAIQQCINAARSAADLQVCIETGGKGRGLTFRSSLEVATYNDTFHVDVFAPGVALSLENPTTGWRVGGSFVVDVVTAASPDIVATASRRFDQTRFGGTLAGEYKIGPAKIGVDGGISGESDYVARSVGVSGSADLFDKRVTPTLAYGFGFDTLGRGDTPFDIYSVDVMRHTIDAGVSVVLDPSTIVVGGATAQFEIGDQSKPYRYINMFDKDVVDQLPKGAVASLVGELRQPVAPLERLPDARSRFAILGRIARRFETATLRVDERLYIDTWGLKASTTDARFLIDLGESLRVGPHVRFHIQSPVDFWKRAYAAALTSTGWSLPTYRTGDRELGPLFGVTAGGGIRYQLTESLSANVQVEGIYTQFLDHIYVFDRLGLFTATTIEVEVE